MKVAGIENLFTGKRQETTIQNQRCNIAVAATG
jgi:hypothetical protein